ncbi:MAG: dTMP kinase [Alphaproteobacteria bacterium]|nr:dTMP kinase [Alphaproteobacteria bacterium]
MASTKFITFEGGEGAGKTTQIKLLAAALEKSGLQVVTTREPGGSPTAERLRDLLFATDAAWDPISESLLLSAARRDHLATTIWPAMKAGNWVLCDRYADSTLAYQGYGKGVERGWLESLYRTVAGDFVPDLTLLLDLPVGEGLKRAGTREQGNNRYEKMDAAFHERLREGYLAIARSNPGRIALIDATGAVAGIQTAIQQAVADRLGVHFP